MPSQSKASDFHPTRALATITAGAFSIPKKPSCVGVRRIELRLQDPQPCVLPLYDTPKATTRFSIDATTPRQKNQKAMMFSSPLSSLAEECYPSAFFRDNSHGWRAAHTLIFVVIPEESPSMFASARMPASLNVWIDKIGIVAPIFEQIFGQRTNDLMEVFGCHNREPLSLSRFRRTQIWRVPFSVSPTAKTGPDSNGFSYASARKGSR